MLNELGKNSDKGTLLVMTEDSGPPLYLHKFLSSMQKHLLAFCLCTNNEHMVSLFHFKLVVFNPSVNIYY